MLLGFKVIKQNYSASAMDNNIQSLSVLVTYFLQLLYFFSKWNLTVVSGFSRGLDLFLISVSTGIAMQFQVVSETLKKCRSHRWNVPILDV